MFQIFIWGGEIQNNKTIFVLEKNNQTSTTSFRYNVNYTQLIVSVLLWYTGLFLSEIEIIKCVESKYNA